MIEKVKIIISWLSEDDELNQYRLRIYWLSWVKAIVVVSNITNLPGRKIANITPQIIHFVNNNFDLSTNQIMLVEHYPIGSLDEDLYFQVLCGNNEVIRYQVSEDELTSLIGRI